MNKPFENTFDVKFDENGIETFNRWQDPTINELQQQLDKYKNVIDKIKEDLIKTKKYNTRCQDTYGNELIKVDIDHINYLLELLEEVE